MSQYHSLLGNTSSLYKNLIYDLNPNTIKYGEDFLVYDKSAECFRALRGANYDAGSFDSGRYETNWDILIGCQNGIYHAVASNEAYGGIGMVNDIYAAAFCYYRIEIDTSTSGGFTYKIESSAVLTGSVTWNKGDTMTTINNKIPSLGNSIKVVLADGKGIGFALGGSTTNATANTITLTNVTGNVNVIDMTKLSVKDARIKNGDSYNSSLPVIDNKFKNWRCSTAQSILGIDEMPIGQSEMISYSNSNLNYKYHLGITYSSFKPTGSFTQFLSDGVNGSTNSVDGNARMTEATFNNYVNSSYASTTNNGKMYQYYNSLFNSIGNDFKEMHDKYVEWYGNMETLYDAYVMSHMLNVDNPTGGCVYLALNLGFLITQAKGEIMTPDYNYKYVPAYPLEYNALHYGKTNNTSAFRAGAYNAPEPYDVGLMYRDDIKSKCNETWSKIPGISCKLFGDRDTIGSCCEVNTFRNWYYNLGQNLAIGSKGDGFFRCRPVILIGDMIG